MEEWLSQNWQAITLYLWTTITTWFICQTLDWSKAKLKGNIGSCPLPKPQSNKGKTYITSVVEAEGLEEIPRLGRFNNEKGHDLEVIKRWFADRKKARKRGVTVPYHIYLIDYRKAINQLNRY